MALSSDLVSQFAKITNDRGATKEEDTILYGTVVQYEDSLCVKLDGSNEITPAITTSTIKAGDRVSVTLKKHTAIITGNLSDPSASSSKVSMTIEDIGVVFRGLNDGTTVINGACIQTGTINAQYLNLTGAISVTDLTEEFQKNLEALEETADDALTTAVLADDRAVTAKDIAKSIANGTYLNGTFIDGKSITSPTIEGNEIKVYGTFQTMGIDGEDTVPTGYMGAAQGMDADGNTTFGVALSYTWNEDDYSVGDNYIIVTNGGVRLQSGDNRIILTPNSIRINTESSKAYYNDVELGTGGGSGGTVTAVWG